MSSFFDSEIIQQEMRELQEFSIEDLIYNMYPRIMMGAVKNNELIDVINKIVTHYEKLKVFHARLVLTDDSEAKKLLEMTEKQYSQFFEAFKHVPGAPKTFNELIDTQINLFKELVDKLEKKEE